MRFLSRRQPDGDYEIFDVRTQKIKSSGLSREDAIELRDNLNRKNLEEVKNFLDENLLPR